MLKKVFADFDDSGVYVYQAFKPETVRIAVEKGTFGKGFGLDRITWIKPSFGWVLHRSNHATTYGMEGIARIKIGHESWLEILRQSVETHWNSDVFVTMDEWQHAFHKSDVIHQWDPERDAVGRRLERQAIQIGIRGEVIKRYVQEYIQGVEDLSALAREIGVIAKARKPLRIAVPTEKEYPLPTDVAHRLGCNV